MSAMVVLKRLAFLVFMLLWIWVVGIVLIICLLPCFCLWLGGTDKAGEFFDASAEPFLEVIDDVANWAGIQI